MARAAPYMLAARGRSRASARCWFRRCGEPNEVLDRDAQRPQRRRGGQQRPQQAPRRSAEQRRESADRMRLHRERKRRGLSCVTVEVRTTEIAALIRSGYLEVERHRDRCAVTAALHAYLDASLK
jgi:hypothetical protein